MIRLLSIEKAPLSKGLDTMLPTSAIHQGYGLTWWSPEAFGNDPIFLYKHKQEVYRWDYVPSMIEVWEKINELERQYPYTVRVIGVIRKG